MEINKDLLVWLEQNLLALLPDLTPEILSYIAGISNKEEIEEFLGKLIKFEDADHRKFYENYLEIRNSIQEERRASKKQKNLKTMTEKMTQLVLDAETSKASELTKKKKKDKFVNLYSPEGANKDVVVLKGRHYCNCQASKHTLVNNCLSCGRIVCSQEGSGPCLFCGSLVCSRREQEVINARNNESKKLYDNLMKCGRPEGWEKALAHRDRLLEFDRTTQKRTCVIDDEGEYYSPTSVWLSPTERIQIEKKEQASNERKNASRIAAKFTLDFAGRQVVEDKIGEDDDSDYEDAIDWTAPPITSSINPAHWKPDFVPSGQLKGALSQLKSISVTNPRVQDKELLEMSDNGACLSLHQPWASLLVHGIKRHEGRTWYTPHRGRLWIAAASKSPSDSDIKETQEYYRLLFPGEEMNFPKQYPVSCLLGCVNLVDCVPQEEYQTRYQLLESDSPFVFICENAVAFTTRFPVSGKHKIYQLDKQIHAAALKMLLRRSGTSL